MSKVGNSPMWFAYLVVLLATAGPGHARPYTLNVRASKTVRMPLPVQSVAVSPDGATLAVAMGEAETSNGAVYLLSLPAGKTKKALRTTGAAQTVSFSPDGNLLAYATSIVPSDGEPTARITVRTTASGKMLWTHAVTVGKGPFWTRIAFEPSGRALVVTHLRRTTTFYDARTGDTLRQVVLPSMGETLADFAFTEDGKVMATACFFETDQLEGGKGEVIVWDRRNDYRRRTISLPEDFADVVVCAPDNISLAILATRMADAETLGDVRICALPSLKQTRRLDAGHALYNARSLAISPHSRLVASGSGYDIYTGPEHQHGEIHVWHLPTGKLMWTSKAHRDIVTSVAFAPSGRMLATGSLDRTVRLWELR